MMMNSSPPSAGDDARRRRWRSSRARDRAQQFVADRVAERVVDRLEIVEVDAEQGEAAAAAPLGLPELEIEMLAEEGAVGQAGQTVVEGELGDPLLALGDAGGHRG